MRYRLTVNIFKDIFKVPRMEGIVEENGSSLDPLSGSQSSSSDQGNTPSGTAAAVLTSSANIVQLIPTQANVSFALNWYFMELNL